MKPYLWISSSLTFGRSALAAALVTLFGAIIGVHSLHAATLVVTSTADDGSPGTLRAALAAAADGDVIDATSVTGTITLLPQFLTSSQLAVTKSIGIVGPGPDKLTIDGNHTSRVFRIFAGLDVVIDGLTITNGNASGAPAGSLPGNHGGGIYNDHSSLTLRNCRVFGNSADEKGGGIFNDGATTGGATLTVDHSTLDGNSAHDGGAIYSDGSSNHATLSVNASTISGNLAQLTGGGVVSSGYPSGITTMTVVASTFSGNTSKQTGGGIFNLGADDHDPNSTTLTVVNSTFTGNAAEGAQSGGSGIFNRAATVEIISSTFSGNSAVGAGITSGGKLHIGNSILQAGFPGENLESGFAPGDSVISHGFNLSSDDGHGYLTAANDQTNVDPKLGPLADNGGPVRTHLPLTGSPAIDRGSSSTLAGFGITTDQRGLARTVDDSTIPNASLGDGTDIGAVEVQAPAPPPPPAPIADVAISFLGADKVSVKQGEVLTYTIAVRNFGPNTAPNVVVTDLMASGTGFLNARATKGTFSAPPVNESGALLWTIGDMANGTAEAAELVVSVLVKGKTTVTNVAVISSDADDPNAENNAASITTSVAAGGNNGGGKKK